MNFGGQTGEMLRDLVKRIENMESEKEELTSDIGDLYKEAKSKGFDTKVLKELIKVRKKDKQRHAEEQEILDLYMHALGMAPDVDEEHDDL